MHVQKLCTFWYQNVPNVGNTVMKYPSLLWLIVCCIVITCVWQHKWSEGHRIYFLILLSRTVGGCISAWGHVEGPEGQRGRGQIHCSFILCYQHLHSKMLQNQACSQDFLKAGYMDVWLYVCMHKNARAGGSGGMLPQEFFRNKMVWDCFWGHFGTEAEP